MDQSRYYLDPYPNQLGQNTIYKVIKPLIANEGIIVKPDYDGGDETTTPKPDTTTPGGNETTTPKPDTTTPGGNETSTPKPETTTPHGNETKTPNGNETTTPNNNDNNSGNNNGNNNGSNNNTNNGKGEYPGEPHLVQTGDLISTIALALMVVVALNAAVLTRKNAKNLFRK